MVNLESRLQEIKTIIDAGEYFTIHKARQYGKTTILHALADFLVDMNFSARDIAGMLQLYEDDYQTGMNVHKMAELLYDYTSGYPYLVSRLCKFMDERIVGKKGFSDRSSA